jgi:amino acid adenylation domain-containing protein
VSHNPLRTDQADQHAAEAFWLVRLDANLHRATLVPDLRRDASELRRYAHEKFSVDPRLGPILKSLDPVFGVSDLTLCTAIVAVLLAKYHRENELLVGVQWSGKQGSTGFLPMLLACDPDGDVAALLSSIAAEVGALLKHSPDSLAYLPQTVGLTASSHRCPLFDVAVAVGPADASLDLAAAPVDVVFVFTVKDGAIGGEIRYAQELFDAERIRGVARHLSLLSTQMATRPTDPIRILEVLSPHERDLVVQGFNRRSADYPLQRTMHALIEQQCQRTPGAVAVVHRDVRLTYDELNRAANRLAQALLARRTSKGGFVCILLERSADFVVAMLAVFKAGAAYVPLDPTYPRDRIEYMLRDSAASTLISSAELLSRFAGVIDAAADLKLVVEVDAERPESDRRTGRAGLELIGRAAWGAATDADPALEVVGSDRAYMIYTSGSSGRPKGAICRHDGALNHLFGELEGVGIRTPFNFLQTAASSSDISVWQFVAPLIFGGATVIADYQTVIDPAALLALIRNHRVTLAEPVPVVLRALIDHLAQQPPSARSIPDLHCLMVTGEALPAELVDRWIALHPAIPIANTYGPTETSDDVTLAVFREPISQRYAAAPIGHPLPNVRLFVLDRDLDPVPVGVPGEICVAGVAVGEGYWRQQDKTEAAFVPCPFPEVASGPMYRTGDLGRWLADGRIEFLGRVDQQVKVRGFRVEPGEIESAMTGHPAIQDAAVVLAADGPGTGRLMGYYVLRKGQHVGLTDLRTFLRESLAEHMIPAVLAPLAALPRTPLGKLDRKALSSTGYQLASDAPVRIEPRTPAERALADIWADVIGVKGISADDNFFEIGGDSMSTIEVITRLREAGYHLAPWDIFQHPVLGALASILDAGAAPSVPLPQTIEELPWDDATLRSRMEEVFPDLEDAYPLSATQRGIYYQTLLLPKSSGAYIEQVAFDVEGDIDAGALQKAWQHVVATTDVLRTAVLRRGGQQPHQVVLRKADLSFEGVDLQSRPEAERRAAVDTIVATERTRGFELKKPPLMRVVLARLGARRSRIVWTYHHLILDGWSEGLVLAAVFRSYDALKHAVSLEPASTARYRDFVAWSEAQPVEPAERYWRSVLSGFQVPAVIHDDSPAITPPAAGTIFHDWHDVTLSPAETRQIDDGARHLGVTLASVIHAAWALLLHRATGMADVIIGSVASGRSCNVAGIDRMAGLVVVTQPLRSRPSGDATVGSWLRLLQLQMAEMRQHEHTSLALIQQWSDVPAARRPLFDTIVVVGNYVGHDLSRCAAGGVEIDHVASYTQPLYALTLFVVPGESVTLRLVYDKKRYAAVTAGRLLDEYKDLIRAMIEQPEQRVANLWVRA